MGAEKKAKPDAGAAKGPAPSPLRRWDRKRIVLTAALLVVIGCALAFSIVQLRRDPNVTAAQEAMARRDFPEARRLLDQSLEANPKDLGVRLLAAQAARRQGDLRAALGHLQACEERGAANAELELERRLLRVQRGDLSDADAMLAACAKSPRDAQTPLMLEAVIEGSINFLLGMLNREKLGQGEMSQSDFARAQRAVDDWLALRPGRVDQVQGHIWRGKLYSLGRDQGKARAAFRQAVEIDPDHDAARELLALALISHAPEESASHLQMLHERDRKNDKVAFVLAQVYHTLGKLDQSAALLDELLADNPDHVLLLIERGHVALDQRRPQDAERWLRRAVQIAPDHPQANLLMSQCLQQTDHAQEAKRYHDRFLEADAKARRP